MLRDRFAPMAGLIYRSGSLKNPGLFFELSSIILEVRVLHNKIHMPLNQPPMLWLDEKLGIRNPHNVEPTSHASAGYD